MLTDLALENRIDTDPERLFLIDSTPVGDHILDSVLAGIAETPETFDVRYRVQHTAEHAERIRVRALERLIERGILQQRNERFLWLFGSRRYPTVDGKADQEVKLRIMSVLFSDEIPDPRDMTVVEMADTCGIFAELLAKREFEHAAPRIAQISGLDLVLRAVSWAVQDRKAPRDKPAARVVGPASQLPAPGNHAAVSCDGKEFVIANVGGRYYGVDGRYTLAGGRRDDCRLACPLHGWTYDVRDGPIVKPPLSRRRIRSPCTQGRWGSNW